MGVDRSFTIGVGVKIPAKKYEESGDVWDIVRPYIANQGDLLTYGQVGNEWSGVNRDAWIGIKRLTRTFNGDSSSDAGFFDLATEEPTAEEWDAMEKVIRELGLKHPLTTFAAVHIY